MSESWMAERAVFNKIPKIPLDDQVVMLGGDIFNFLVEERFITMPTLMVRRPCLEEIGGFDENLRSQTDYDLYLRLARTYTVGYLDRRLAKCRLHGRNISCDTAQRFNSKIILWQKFLNHDSDLSPDSRRLMLRRLAEAYNNLGNYYFARNELTRSRNYFRTALKYDWPSKRSLMNHLASFLPADLIDTIRGLKRRWATQ
jgi:hypothetical protein